jgi:hypothetical protein
MALASDSIQSTYQSIGQSLLAYEQKAKHITSDINFAFTELRENLAFIQVEVLESYLEDLLNPKVSDEALCIARKRTKFYRFIFDILVIVTALSAGLLFIEYGYSKYTAFLAIFCSFLPFYFLSKYSPFLITRRMSLARALSKEISRRRGRDDDDNTRTKIAIKDFFIRSNAGGIQGTAKIKYH